ncbi:WXG100 family type VII secretion target [Nocardioides sp. YIM 152315]|uniref:WXG100 family type VII secretion target n=1 Tax=Nocardioides sp. YIM 152315 TaxID=3031760 RepID=UPI0023DBF015|nr:WXG100 family type VII secretion target [Nocardioides sp. YIM 152315]MDF1604057.1 WXG100 family type VII secretion target [Nocardioides sp. YIM 152315]
MHAVDLDLLAETLVAMKHCGEALDARLAEVAAQVGALQSTWTGDAADAQATAQAEWEAGFESMREGLAAMRAAGELAADNYHAAVDTNLLMWGQVS